MKDFIRATKFMILKPRLEVKASYPLRLKASNLLARNHTKTGKEKMAKEAKKMKKDLKKTTHKMKATMRMKMKTMMMMKKKRTKKMMRTKSMKSSSESQKCATAEDLTSLMSLKEKSSNGKRELNGLKL